MRKVFRTHFDKQINIYIYEELCENGIKFDKLVAKYHSWKSAIPWLTVGTIYITMGTRNNVVIRRIF